MATRKIAPALAAGCTVILKPASETPLTAYALAALYEEAGVPPGVVNVLTTSNPGPVTAAMLADPRVRKLSFTGSTGVGRLLLAEAAKHVISCSMELGGNAPFIVFDDADLEAALDGAMVAKMRNAGEACTAANRIYVQSGIHDAFAEGLRKRMAALKVGAGVEAATECGPMITKKAVDKIDRLVQDAVARGARVLCGGSIGSGTGFFYPPTVLCDVPADAEMAHEEIFGPVAPISRFEQESEAIARANDTEYGLAAYIYTRDLARGMRVAAKIEAGMIALNRGLMSDPAAPFGGVKQSGIGREGGQAARHRRVHGGEISRRRDVDGGQVQRDPFNRDHVAPWVKKQNCGEVQSRQAQAFEDKTEEINCAHHQGTGNIPGSVRRRSSSF